MRGKNSRSYTFIINAEREPDLVAYLDACETSKAEKLRQLIRKGYEVETKRIRDAAAKAMASTPDELELNDQFLTLSRSWLYRKGWKRQAQFAESGLTFDEVWRDNDEVLVFVKYRILKSVRFGERPDRQDWERDLTANAGWVDKDEQIRHDQLIVLYVEGAERHIVKHWINDMGNE